MVSPDVLVDLAASPLIPDYTRQLRVFLAEELSGARSTIF
jgi:hypothetical protein